MKKLAALLVTTSLAGCAGQAAITPASTSAFVTEVQQLTVAACGFVPTATTVAQLAAAASNSASAGVALGAEIAQAVCSGVTAIPTAKGGKKGARVPRWHGVWIHGKFVR